jgi:hypothetical protein
MRNPETKGSFRLVQLALWTVTMGLAGSGAAVGQMSGLPRHQTHMQKGRSITVVTSSTGHLEFGVVAEGQSVDLPFTLSNTGRGEAHVAKLTFAVVGEAGRGP